MLLPRHVLFWSEQTVQAYTEATIKAGQGAVEKMQEDIRAKVFQKTTATNGPLMLRKAFKFFDNDKSGGIDPDEVLSACVSSITENPVPVSCRYE